MNTLTKEVKEELTSLIIDTLEDGYSGYVCDLHNEVFNTDYFIIGTYEAKKWLENNYGVFEAIEKVMEYEQDNFGEVNTEIHDPEKLCNMLVYILGEEIMQEIDAINGDNWNEEMTPEIRQAILDELKD